MNKLTPIALSLALALPAVASAQSSAELQSQIEVLKAQISELRKVVATQPAVTSSVDTAEFNRMRLKVEAMEDAQEESGFSGLKVSGFIDPTYIYSQRADRGSFVFLNNPDLGAAVNDLSADDYGYQNSNFGGVTLKFEKTFDNGMSAMLSLRPHKGGTDTLVEEALVTIPINDSGVSAIVGKQISWNGYEYANSPDMKTVTHNLLYDFGGPYYVVGAGLKANVGDWALKGIVGNLNAQRNLQGAASQGVHWRADYAINEFMGLGFSGMHGKIADKGYNYLEADYWYTKGDLTLNAQLEGSEHKDSAWNGGKASTVGASLLAAYKFAPRWESVARVDWLDNHKNGGLTPALYTGTCSNVIDGDFDCGDYRNGFGPGMVFDEAAGEWRLGDESKGTKRSAYTFGVNYQIHENALLKFELRHDRSDLYSFVDADGSYKKYNNTLGVQTVVKF